MSDEKQETMVDIVADIRERAENAMRNGERLVHNEAVAMLLRSVADRLEAAWKRDEEHAVEHATRHAEAVARDNCRDCVHNPKSKNYEGGNAAAMREALNRVLIILRSIIGAGESDAKLIRYCERHIRAALSAPARNCDVGTPEQQAQRFYNFCQGHSSAIAGMCDPNCPCIGSVDKCHCLCQWEKLPYEEDADNGEPRNEEV